MKFLNLIALTSILSLSAHASLEIDIKPYLNKSGTGHEMGTNIGECSLKVEDGAVSFEGTYYTMQYVEVSAQLDSSSNGINTYVSSANGKRPGGDQCGDYGGMFGFKKVLVINSNSKTVSIINSFRCALDFGKKYVLEWACKF
ncbi:MAG: hypothetical protein AB7I27_13285 [Bacteriovoracaceae bacterium]